MTAPLTYATEVNVPTDGADSDVWGLIVNAAFAAWDRHLGGVHAVTFTAATVTLTAEQAQNGRIFCTGSPASALGLDFPARNRTYAVSNALSTDHAIILRMDATPSNRLLLPPSTTMLVRTNTTTGRVVALSPPLVHDGGFPASIQHDGDAFSGPGIFFTGHQAGFANPDDGIIGVWLDATAEEQASVRFNVANSEDDPLIGIAAGFNTGLFIPATGKLGFTVVGAEALRLGTGVYAPALSDPGAGKANFSQYLRSGVVMPFQKIARRTALPVGSGEGSGANHSQGSEPEMVFAKLRCTSSDAGWAAQDVVHGGVSFGDCNIAFGGNATQLYYRQNVNGLVVPNKSTGLLTTADESKWKLELLGCWP
jgi:hypothetical protein